MTEKATQHADEQPHMQEASEMIADRLIEQSIMRIFDTSIKTSLLVTIILVTLWLLLSPVKIELFQLIPQIPLIVVLLILLFIKSIQTRTIIALVTAYSLGVYNFWIYGVVGDARIFYMMCTFTGAVLLPVRYAHTVTIICALTHFVLGFASLRGVISLNMSVFVSEGIALDIFIRQSLLYIAAGIVTATIINWLLATIKGALDKELRTASSLRMASEELRSALARESTLTQSLQTALTSEQQINQLRTEFVKTVSHEFRTPLTVIKTSADLLEHYQARLSAERQQAHFDNIGNGVNHLVQLTEKIVTAKPENEADLDQLMIEMSTSK